MVWAPSSKVMHIQPTTKRLYSIHVKILINFKSTVFCLQLLLVICCILYIQQFIVSKKGKSCLLYLRPKVSVNEIMMWENPFKGKVLPSNLESKKYFQNCLDRRNVINTLCDIPHHTPHYHKSWGFISELALD